MIVPLAHDKIDIFFGGKNCIELLELFASITSASSQNWEVKSKAIGRFGIVVKLLEDYLQLILQKP
jgi:hypothetical protein